MTLVASVPQITADEFLHLSDAVDYELVDGKLVERNMGWESSEIALRIALLIGFFMKGRKLGRLAGADASYQCYPDAPTKVRKPDVSFIRADRLPSDKTPQGHCPVAPDLVVEVISPGDESYEVEVKIAEYLKAGVPLIWVVHPPTRTVRVHRPRTAKLGPVSELTDVDTISGEDVLPGFSASVKEFFE